MNQAKELIMKWKQGAITFEQYLFQTKKIYDASKIQ